VYLGASHVFNKICRLIYQKRKKKNHGGFKSLINDKGRIVCCNNVLVNKTITEKQKARKARTIYVHRKCIRYKSERLQKEKKILQKVPSAQSKNS
jgi:hypothetical protein